MVFVYTRFRPIRSNAWQKVKLADVYSVRDGRIVQMNAFVDRQPSVVLGKRRMKNDKSSVAFGN